MLSTLASAANTPSRGRGQTLEGQREAVHRARRRARSGGAVIFVVAVTLALLASMGVYGLTATANDVRASGHFREAAQARNAAQLAAFAVAETFTPSTSSKLLQDMLDPNRRSNATDPRACRTANVATTNVATRAAEACLILGEQEIATLSSSTNPLRDTATKFDSCNDPAECPLFDKYGLGKGTVSGGILRPFVRTEITNPVDVPGPPGMGLNFKFTQVTVSVFVEMRRDNSDPVKALQTPPEAVALGRGRFTVGPISR